MASASNLGEGTPLLLVSPRVRGHAGKRVEIGTGGTALLCGSGRCIKDRVVRSLVEALAQAPVVVYLILLFRADLAGEGNDICLRVPKLGRVSIRDAKDKADHEKEIWKRWGRTG